MTGVTDTYGLASKPSRGCTKHLNWCTESLNGSESCWNKSCAAENWNCFELHARKFLEDILLVNSVLFLRFLRRKIKYLEKNCVCVYMQCLLIDTSSCLSCHEFILMMWYLRNIPPPPPTMLCIRAPGWWNTVLLCSYRLILGEIFLLHYFFCWCQK